MAARADRSGKRTNAIGIDLGTTNTLIHLSGRGVVVREPTVVAVDRRRGAVVCGRRPLPSRRGGAAMYRLSLGGGEEE